MLGQFKEGEDLCAKGLHFAREIDNRYSLAFSGAYYGFTLGFKGDGKRALEALDDAMHYCEATQFATAMVAVSIGLGLAHFSLGEMEAAQRDLERAIKIHTEIGMFSYMSTAYLCLAMVHFFSGDAVKARRYAEEGVRLAQQHGERIAEGSSWMLLGAVLGAADPSQSSLAEEHLLRGIAMTEELGARPLSSLGHLLLGQHYANSGQREKAREHLSVARSMYEEMGMDVYLTMAQSALENLSK